MFGTHNIYYCQIRPSGKQTINTRKSVVYSERLKNKISGKDSVLSLFPLIFSGIKKESKLKIIIQIIAWALFISAPFFFMSADNIHTHRIPVVIIFLWIFLIAFYYSNYYLFIPKLLFKKKVALYILIILFCFFAFICFPEVLLYFNIGTLHRQVPSNGTDIARLSSLVFFLLAFIISTSIALISELFDAWEKKQLLEVGKTKAELLFLKSQVNPHFLFNTLYSIYYLTVNKSDKASQAIMKLSDIIRFVLTESQCDYIQLEKEIDYITKYIDLQKLRISEKTKINFNVCGNIKEKQIAPLILIPFVENAFKYGVSSHVETLIKISLIITETSLELDLSNNKFDIIIEQEKNNIGLRNVKQRLLLLYPQKHKLIIKDEPFSYSINLTICLK
jgi:two-component system, LytTR family, sensor kinase